MILENKDGDPLSLTFIRKGVGSAEQDGVVIDTSERIDGIYLQESE